MSAETTDSGWRKLVAEAASGDDTRPQTTPILVTVRHDPIAGTYEVLNFRDEWLATFFSREAAEKYVEACRNFGEGFYRGPWGDEPASFKGSVKRETPS